MTGSEKRAPATHQGVIGFGAQAMLIAFGLAAPFATYAIAVSPLTEDVRVTLLTALACVYLSICVWTVIQLRKSRNVYGLGWTAPEQPARTELDEKLAALEDAREFFGSSLKPADMFRLVSNRVHAIVPYETGILLTRTGDGHDLLRITQAFGSNAAALENTDVDSGTSLAGLAFLSGEIETAEALTHEREHFPSGLSDELRASAAIPLIHEGDVFAIYQLFFKESSVFGDETADKLHAIAERVAPLFLGSMAFERSLSNALTDPITKLPNERAFYMVLENQLAESHRFRDERPLTVLAVDIKEFEDLNKTYGHATGDKALGFAAELINSQLRKMDFLARSMNDEFLIVLPKASERTAMEIIARMRAKFASTPMPIADGETAKIWLNFGWATFWQDGETATQLVRYANMRKIQSKTEDVGNVVSFPKEYVN